MGITKRMQKGKFMQSAEINHRGLMGRRDITFSSWFTLDEVVKHAPKTSGIYVMKSTDGRRFGRVSGESDIVYIGSSENLRARLQQHRLYNFVLDWFSKMYPINVAFAETSSPATLYETILMQGYIANHHELPPLNHQDVKKHLLKPPRESLKPRKKAQSQAQTSPE